MSPRRCLARSFAVGLAALVVACSGSGSGAGTAAPPARLLLTAGTNVVPATPGAIPVVDLAPLGAARANVYYRLTTPADTPLQFELVSWQTDARGTASITIDHVRDGDTPVTADPLSLSRVGLMTTGNAMWSDGERTSASGDGFVRVTIQGRIARDQVLAVLGDDDSAVVIELAIGPASEINRPLSSEPQLPSVVSRDTVYSSASWSFGLPTVAVSGDRTSVVCYEGDRNDPNAPARYELRLQHDAGTGAVTGGATLEANVDSGFWRDHEIVALYNVLGVVRSERSGVRVRLSFDRGATFAQDVELLAGFTQSRLVQAAMAADYSLAVGAWRAREQGGLEFVLVEGRPVAFDTNGSPTWFQFTPAQSVHVAPPEATPLTTGIAWSEGGDLVLGYACNWMEPAVGGGWRTTTEYRCAVRPWSGALADRRVDDEILFGLDPTVAVLGQGAGLRIFYAYEVAAGVRLATSDDAGGTWTLGPTFGQRGDYLPSVFAREANGRTRVDVLYLAHRANGAELHRSSWPDWPGGPRVDEALTRAECTTSTVSPGFGAPGWPSLRVKQVNFFGYDAVRDGDQIVVVYDEMEFESAYMCTAMLMPNAMTTGVPGGLLPPAFGAAAPPPLAPGLTLPMPAPDAAHAHQLTVLRLQ